MFWLYKQLTSNKVNNTNEDNSDNNNNNNNVSIQQQPIKKIILPIIIQKKIYKYLIITQHDKSEHESYELNAQVIKKFSSLSWEWFNILSIKIQHTLVLKDYSKPISKNFTNSNKYLLRKPDSIKYLKLQNLSKLNSSISIQFVNKLISILNNLKWITVEHNNNVFSEIKFENFRINSMVCYPHEKGTLQKHIKRIDLFYIQSQVPPEKIIDAFSTSKIYGLKANMEHSWSQFNILKFPFNQLTIGNVGGGGGSTIVDNSGNENRLQWLRKITLHASTLNTIYQFLKSCPQLNEITLTICSNNLIYRLNKRYNSNFQDEINHDGEEEEEDDTTINSKLRPCHCTKTVENLINGVTNDNDDSSQFSIYWDEISKLISNHRNLKTLIISNRCFMDTRLNMDDMAETYGRNHVLIPMQSSEHRQYLFQQLSTIIGNNKSIETFDYDVDHFEHLEIIDQLLNSNNQTIKHYKFKFINGPSRKVSQLFYKKLNDQYLSGDGKTFKNEHILSFRIYCHTTIDFEFIKYQ